MTLRDGLIGFAAGCALTVGSVVFVHDYPIYQKISRIDSETKTVDAQIERINEKRYEAELTFLLLDTITPELYAVANLPTLADKKYTLQAQRRALVDKTTVSMARSACSRVLSAYNFDQN